VAVLKAKVAVPMHVGAGVGDPSMAEQFRKKATVPVQVLKMEK
jgi:hypothetical protein